MCFSPEMDLTAGTVVLAIGVDAVRQVRSREQLLLASLPVVFGVHQLIETLVWWWQRGHVSTALGSTAAFAYLLIALVIVPVWAPLAFHSLRVIKPRWLSAAFVGCGVLAALADLWGLGRGPVHPMIMGHHIMYPVDVPFGRWSFAPYLIAAVAPPLLCRDSLLRAFGLGNLAAVGVIAWTTMNGMISIWCVWAAITSVVINAYLRRSSASGSLVMDAAVAV